ncbi:outer membrane protein assembly factor BamD [Blattabacterium cuenoti]|uniref:outer membrane protein assembly factor BamD n=1 Tax=Blattabacterium cuenoti TaxID=1653831 RepID=UPI00163C5472|nr:tetratricopeptide repeat protein [Blattabacterium cuenoti]
MNMKVIFLIIIFMSFFESCVISKKKYVSLELEKENELIEENLFESGKYYYFSSLNFNLDKNKTDIAINKFNQFIKKYPKSLKIKEVYKLLNDLLMKIERKNYYIANLYFIMHKYQTSLDYFQDFIKDFPESNFKEKVLYKICVSQYKLYKKKDFIKSYNDYMKYFSYYKNNTKKLKILYKKLKN